MTELIEIGKTFIAVLEKQVEGVLGKDAIEELRKPVDEAKLQANLLAAARRAEHRWLEKNTEPSLQAAVEERFRKHEQAVQAVVKAIADAPAQAFSAATLRSLLRKIAPQWVSEARIDQAVADFLELLRQEVVAIDRLRDYLVALSTAEKSGETAQNTEQLVALLASIKQRLEHAKYPEVSEDELREREMEVEIVIRDENAYRITFVGESTRFTDKLTVIGVSKITTTLPVDSYQVILESLDGTLLTEPFRINIERDGQILDLTGKVQTRDKQEDAPSQELPVQMINLRRSALFAKAKSSPSSSAESSIPPSAASAALAAALKHWRPSYFHDSQKVDPLKFAIGISEDSKPEQRGGWGPVEDLDIDHEILENGHLQLRIRTDDTNSEKRVRATFTLQGKPAIRLPVPLYKPGVIIDFQPIFDLNGLDILVSINAKNSSVNVLTSAIDHLSESEAESVFALNELSEEDVTEIFYYKRRDPWAATAAAVLLTSLRRLKPISRWAYNLKDMTPYISDTAIVAAWAQVIERELLPETNEEKILEHLILGRRRGAPIFVITNSLATDLLRILATSGTTATIRREAKNEYRWWSDKGKRRVEAGSYFVWEQVGDNLQRGELPNQRYTIIQEGHLSEDGFVF